MSDAEEQTQNYSIIFDGDGAASQFVHKDGSATATFPNKDVFKGAYVNGVRSGKGEYIFANGAVYGGEYLNNKRHGQGVLRAPDRSHYSGEWKDGQRHGQGTYTFANGDTYSGCWVKGHRHGQGTYTYAHDAGVIVGNWVEGNCVSGTWEDASHTRRFIGGFNNNQLGQGSAVSVAGVQTGAYKGTEWKQSGDFEKPHPHAIPPEPHPADHATRHARAIRRAVLKLDHFQAIYRLPKTFEGVPNFRRVDGFPVFGSGQPTFAGIQTVLQNLAEQGFSKFVWTCMRQEPVIYVNQMSFAPREPHNLNENMEFEGITSDMLLSLQDDLASKYKDLGQAHGHVEYYQDTYAENPADRQNIMLKDPVQATTDVRTLTEVYRHLKEDKELEVQLQRLPIADERAPRVEDFDTLVGFLKEIEEGSAILFNCQMGKGRTTTGMVCACLLHMVKNGDIASDNKANADEESPAAAEDEDADEETRAASEAKFQEQKQAAAAAAAKPFPQNPPSLKDGEYKMIVDLVNKLPNGVHIKSDVDRAIDGAHHMQNLRECILYTKENYDKETEERRKFWKRMSDNFIERYFYLICFQAYLRDAQPGAYEVSFSQWCKDHADLFTLMGTREAGPLSEFNWE